MTPIVTPIKTDSGGWWTEPCRTVAGPGSCDIESLPAQVGPVFFTGQGRAALIETIPGVAQLLCSGTVCLGHFMFLIGR